MFDAERRRCPQFGFPGIQRLAGKGINQIERHTAEDRLRRFDAAHCLGGGVVAAEEFQRLVVKRLHTKRQTVDAGGAEAFVARNLGVGRVGFERDFDIVRMRKELAGLRDQFHHPVRRQKRRGAASEKNAGQLARTQPFRLPSHICQSGIEKRALG